MVERIATLRDANDRLREVLLRFRTSNDQLGELVARGESIREAIGIEIPQRRRQELTAAIDAFEAARQEYRQALFAVCFEEGASISEVGRALGISRQRASHLTRKANKEA